MNFDCQAVKDVQIQIFLNGRKAGTIKDGQHLNGKPAIMYVYKPANNQLELKFLKKTAASDFTCKLLSSSIAEREIYAVSNQDIPADVKVYVINFNITARGYYPNLEPMLKDYQEIYARNYSALPEAKLPPKERSTAEQKANEIRNIIMATEIPSEAEAKAYIEKEIDSLKQQVRTK